MKGRPASLLAALGCFAAALVLKFALLGYSFSAGLLAAAGVLILLYRFLALRGKKKWRTALTVLLCAGAAAFAAFETPVVLASGGNAAPGCDYIVVLGAAVRGDVPSLAMEERLGAALAYLNDNPGCTAVVSGGQGPGEDVSEAEAMRVWLVSSGVDPARVVTEDASRTTAENLKNSLAIIRERGGGSVAVVSSEYHLCRAERMAKLLGADVSGVPAHTSLPFLRLNYFLREGFAMAYLAVFGL